MRLLPLALLALVACKSATDPAAQASLLVERFVDASLDADPDMGRAAGLHAYDGKVPPVTPARVSEEVARAKAHLAETAALDLRALPDPLRLDVQITRLAAERTIFRLETLALHRRVMAYLDLFDLTSYLVRDYAPLADRTARLLDHVEAATRAVDGILATLDPVQVKTQLETAKGALSGVADYFAGDVAAMTKAARDADPALAKRYDGVIPEGAAAVAKMLAWIDAHTAQANDDYRLGEERFLRMLEVNEGLHATLPSLEAMAQQNFQANHDAYVATAKRIDPTKSVAEVAAMVAAERLPNGDAVMAAARRQSAELRRFLVDKRLVTLGSEEEAIVAVTPPFMRWNSAFLDPAGPFEQVTGSYYYITPPDPSWPKDVQEGYLPYEGDLLATTIHEVYPGHFVQGLQVKRAASRAQKLFDSYAFVEGWAHYVEQMMFDEGYGGDDARLQLGQLSNALLRNCRFLAAIGMHTRTMSVDEADKLFREQCFVDAGNAKQQAYRGTFDPGYLSYTLGKVQILELREKYRAKHPDKSLGDFHDWLLSFGNAPVALIAERL